MACHSWRACRSTSSGCSSTTPPGPRSEDGSAGDDGDDDDADDAADDGYDDDDDVAKAGNWHGSCSSSCTAAPTGCWCSFRRGGCEALATIASVAVAVAVVVAAVAAAVAVAAAAVTASSAMVFVLVLLYYNTDQSSISPLFRSIALLYTIDSSPSTVFLVLPISNCSP
jgi:hypothetical protein